MRIIDRYAYNNHIRTVEPGYKAGLALTVILLCLLLNKPQVGLVAAGGMFLLAVGLAGIPARTFGRILFAEKPALMIVGPATLWVAGLLKIPVSKTSSISQTGSFTSRNDGPPIGVFCFEPAVGRRPDHLRYPSSKGI